MKPSEAIKELQSLVDAGDEEVLFICVEKEHLEDDLLDADIPLDKWNQYLREVEAATWRMDAAYDLYAAIIRLHAAKCHEYGR